MNILHHKSWHVRNKRNIERVRRDEKKALEEELEKERKRKLAESEVRLDVLRFNAKLKRKAEGSTYLDSNNRIELFPEKSDSKDIRKNREHEIEAKNEQEEWEKKVGILTYLGQGMNEPDFEKPWYLDSHSKRMKLEDEPNPNSRAARKLANEDPLNEMKKIFTVMKKSKNK